jgi:hypothetical protein
VPRPVREKLQSWEVIRLKASPAAFVGYVEAPDKQTESRLTGALTRRRITVPFQRPSC